MTVKNLKNTPFKIILDCFNKAFNNYFVPLPTDANYWEKRWQLAKVDYRLSYGMFDSGKLVGFIINAVDKRKEDIIAYNTGTGVLPKYRGKRIIKSIYKYALTDLKQNGITKCTLEVIVGNTIAIKSYESIGFNIIKTYKCFNGTINIEKDEIVELNKISYNQLNWNKLPNQENYSWDNHFRIIKKGNYHYYQIIKNNKPESYFVINKENGNLAQFEVLHDNNSSWARLFIGIKSISSTIKINNVDLSLQDKINFLDSIGIKNTVDQYEMELKL